MDIKPIHTQKDYKEALQIIESLMDAKPGTAEGDRLDIMATLVESYEQKHFPIEAPDPVEAILFVMEQRGLERRDMEPYIGQKGRVSEILGHKRNLTLPMIRRLHQELGIPADVLIAESIKSQKYNRL